jgi:hypothetical protein
VISPTQRRLPENTQHPLETDIHTPGRIDPSIPESERLQIHTLDSIHIQRHFFFLERDIFKYQVNRKARVSQDGEVLRREIVLTFWPTYRHPITEDT